MDYLTIIFYAFVAGIFALVGGVVFLYNEKLSRVLEKYSVPFAAGVLLAISFMGLMPEAVHLIGDDAFYVVLATFVGAYLFENILFGLHHHDGQNKFKGSAPLVIVGDTIHNFIDGVAIASSYLVSPQVGLLTTLSTFLHEVPHEIGDFGILLKSGWKRNKVFWVNLASASTTILGAIFVLFFVENEAIIGFLLAVAAGMFLYLATSDFLPNIQDELDLNSAILSLVLGVSLMSVLLLAFGHSHEADEHVDDAIYEEVTNNGQESVIDIKQDQYEEITEPYM